MKADSAVIHTLVHGASRILEHQEGFEFFRFTESQAKVYAGNVRALSAAGIRLEFETDASSFSMSGNVSKGSSRKFYYFDVEVNGCLIRHEGAESYEEYPDFSFEVPLPTGINHVSVWFPGLEEVRLDSLEFCGGTVHPVSKHRTLFCFGDSITQGYDARYPSLAYPNQLARAFDADVFNKAIGGDLFRPEIADADPDPVHPDLITVAYGTNDWGSSRERLEETSLKFFEILSQRYPDVPICVILPLWRRDCGKVTAVGTFSDVADIIRKNSKPFRNIMLIDGMGLIPHLDSCFSPDGLHPSDFFSSWEERLSGDSRQFLLFRLNPEDKNDIL